MDDPDAAPQPDGSASAGRLERARDRLDGLGQRLRSTSGVVDAAVHVAKLDTKVGGGLMAGALAFRLFFFLVPFSLFVFTAVGTASTLADRSPSEMAKQAGIAGVLAKGVVNTAELSDTQRWVLLAVAGYAMFMAARSVVTTIVAASCLVWEVPRIRIKKFRPAIGFIVFITVVMWLTTELGKLRDSMPAPGIALTVVWMSIPFLAGWWLMFRLPHRDAPVWALIPGAVVFAIGLQLMHVVTVVYIANSAASKSETYGVLGVSLATLLWCYLVGRLAIGTSVLNASLWRRYQERHPELHALGSTQHQSMRTRLREWGRYTAELFR